MEYENKTKTKLISEIKELSRKVNELKKVEEEHKKAEENIRKNEEKYHSLFENMFKGWHSAVCK